MKYSRLLPILILTIVGLTALTAFKLYFGSDMEKSSGAIKNNKGFAVLELFTSEGCSSCPPADKLMAQMQNEFKNQPVYLLAFHVDYWNRLGWKDVFSNADYSKRQREYGNWFNLNSVYTPQLVVNGSSEFVGSDEFKIRKAIANSLATDQLADLSVRPDHAGDNLTLHYIATGASERSRLLIALVQKSAKIKVEAGENEGRLLTHSNIVRDLYTESLPKDGKGLMTIKLPKDFNPADWEVIALIQELNKGGISAVVRVRI